MSEVSENERQMRSILTGRADTFERRLVVERMFSFSVQHHQTQWTTSTSPLTPPLPPPNLLMTILDLPLEDTPRPLMAAHSTTIHSPRHHLPHLHLLHLHIMTLSPLPRLHFLLPPLLHHLQLPSLLPFLTKTLSKLLPATVTMILL